MKETASTEQNPVNNMTNASSLLPIGSTQLSLMICNKSDAKPTKASEIVQQPPIKDRHFEVPAKFKEFCNYDTGTPENERMLIFGTQENLGSQESLKNNNALRLCGGTFKIPTIQFYQPYKIHVQIGGFCLAIYALLSNKRENLYWKFLTGLHELTGEPMVSASFDLVIGEIHDVLEIRKIE